MAGKYSDLFSALAAPFDEGEVKWRWADKARTRKVNYVTARTVMNRLDEVLGPENWWDAYTHQGQGILCSITIRLPDGTLLPKQDGGGFAGMEAEDDNEKSGYSDAFKRAAVKFGVARYLYRDGVPHLNGETHEVNPEVPTQPSDAIARDQQLQKSHYPQRTQKQQSEFVGTPKTGRQLFAAIRQAEEQLGTQLLGSVNAAAKELGIKGRMVDWTSKELATIWPIAAKLITPPEQAVS